MNRSSNILISEIGLLESEQIPNYSELKNSLITKFLGCSDKLACCPCVALLPCNVLLYQCYLVFIHLLRITLSVGD